MAFLQPAGFQTFGISLGRHWQYNTPCNSTSTAQSKAAANQRTLHLSVLHDGNRCIYVSNICTIFFPPAQTEQSNDLEPAYSPHTALIISEADHKCDMNNYLFPICYMLHEGNKPCRKCNAPGQDAQNKNSASVSETQLKRIQCTPHLTTERFYSTGGGSPSRAQSTLGLLS